MSAVPPKLIGESAVARALHESIRMAAASGAKVLITGESGVGKEVVARMLHAHSPRAHQPMVTINCAGVPDTLLESEFFGHVKGSFTGAYRDRAGLLERADGGTVFLDEIGEMSVRLQGLLLRFLETGEIQRVGSARTERLLNVRVVTASNRSLEAEVEKKAFREDLFYRLNVVRLHVPPLRARLEDVPLLARHFVDEFGPQHHPAPVQFSPDAIDALCGYHWPGNVRELRNVIERTLVGLKGDSITAAHLPADLLRGPALTRNDASSDCTTSGSVQQAEWERLFDRIVSGGESFWTVVHDPFMARDLTREHIRCLVACGLARVGLDYNALAGLFNMKGSEARRFIAFLRRFDCHVPLDTARRTMVKAELQALALTRVR